MGLALCLFLLGGLQLHSAAQEADRTAISTALDRSRSFLSSDEISPSLTVVFVITLLSLAPAMLIMTTSFTRVLVVLGFLRQAMATQQTPPNQVLIGLALFLTFFIMMPTYVEVDNVAIQPYLRGEFGENGEVRAVQEALKPIRAFMIRQTRPQDIALFMEIAQTGPLDSWEDLPTTPLIPAFMLSEMTKAFQIGFILYIPFLIIDMVVASTLMAMGMMMLPPIFVSLPFKIIMSVLADGWYLLIESLTRSYF